MTVKKPLYQLLIDPFVRELRVLTGLTQEQFAAQLGVTYSSVSRWERGRGIPSPLAMQKIEKMVQQMGERGKELLEKYLAESVRSHNRNEASCY
jgi:transcriptional regulator with XRE-family HTH domain